METIAIYMVAILTIVVIYSILMGFPGGSSKANLGILLKLPPGKRPHLSEMKFRQYSKLNPADVDLIKKLIVDGPSNENEEVLLKLLEDNQNLIGEIVYHFRDDDDAAGWNLGRIIDEYGIMGLTPEKLMELKSKE